MASEFPAAPSSATRAPAAPFTTAVWSPGRLTALLSKAPKRFTAALPTLGSIKGSSAFIVSNVSHVYGRHHQHWHDQRRGFTWPRLNLFGIGTFSGTISNSGDIVGHTGIQLSNASGGIHFSSSSGSGTIVNSGTIIGSGGTAVTIPSAASPSSWAPATASLAPCSATAAHWRSAAPGSDTFALGGVGRNTRASTSSTS